MARAEEGDAMRNWWREASQAAAVSFGFRHSGLFAALQMGAVVLRAVWWLVRYVLAPVAVLTAVAGLGWFLWGEASRRVSIGMLVVIAAVAGAVVVVAVLTQPVRRSWRRWRDSYYI